MAEQVRKATRGRQKIEMKKIENEEDRMISFSKRKAGILKKAAEISIMCGAKVAFIIFSSTGKAYTFGHPSVNFVIGKFQDMAGGDQPEVQQNDNIQGLIESNRDAKINELAEKYNVLGEEIESEKRRVAMLRREEGSRTKDGWWEQDINKLELVEAMKFHEVIENFKNQLKTHMKKLERKKKKRKKTTIPKHCSSSSVAAAAPASAAVAAAAPASAAVAAAPASAAVAAAAPASAAVAAAAPASAAVAPVAPASAAVAAAAASVAAAPASAAVVGGYSGSGFDFNQMQNNSSFMVNMGSPPRTGLQLYPSSTLAPSPSGPSCPQQQHQYHLLNHQSISFPYRSSPQVMEQPRLDLYNFLLGPGSSEPRRTGPPHDRRGGGADEDPDHRQNH